MAFKRVFLSALLLAISASKGSAAFVYSIGDHATTHTIVGGAADSNTGPFAASSYADNSFFDGSPSLESASATAIGTSTAWGGFELKTDASSTERMPLFSSSQVSGTATADAFWADRVFVHTTADTAPTIRINYLLHGFLSALPLGHDSPQSYADLYAHFSVTQGSEFFEQHTEESHVEGSPEHYEGFSERLYEGSFLVPLTSTGEVGEYYADLLFHLQSYVQQASAHQLTWDISSDFGHTFYLTGATANGVSLEEAGVTLEFQSQLERDALAEVVPEPASLAIWSLGALGCAVAGYRRRRQAA